MSKGSYTSVPVIIAAWILRIPIVVHESDSTPGLANKLAAKFTSYVNVTYSEAHQFFPHHQTTLTGIPIRKTFFAPISNPYELLNIDSSRPVLFVTGGSQGAERINNLILDSLDELLPHFTIIHQVGTVHETTVSQTAGSLITDLALLGHYFVYGHMDSQHFAAAQQVATLVISRAGSGTIAELALQKKPSILIPIPEDISHDQRTNAYAYARLGAATVMEEKNLTDALLCAEIFDIVQNKGRYRLMSEATQQFAHPEAAYVIADQLLAIGESHR